MKHKRSQKRTAVNYQGKEDIGDKTTLTKANKSSLVSPCVQVKPFAGKEFYLDLPSNRTAENLEIDIRQLGGTVEKFFSKEIKYLISNKREARYIHCLRQDSPVPSPDSGQSSPLPGSKPHPPIKSRPLGQPETFVTSRGKSLVHKVVNEKERVKINKILSNALDWGVKILYIDDVLTYVKKKKIKYQIPSAPAVNSSVKTSRQGFSKCKERRIRKPFIKVEDLSRHYRPIFLTLPNMPVLNLKTVAPCSPFCIEDKNRQGNMKQGQSKDKIYSRKKNKEKKRGGYCECCLLKYDDLTLHLQSISHKTFSCSNKYLVVDKLISTLQCNFIHLQSKAKRKCSISSVLLAPGLSSQTNPRHKDKPTPSQTLKDIKKLKTVDWFKESPSGQLKKLLLSNDTALQSHAEDKQTNACTYSAHKKPRKQKSHTSCSQRNNSDVYEYKSETEAPRDEFLHPSSSHVEDKHLQHIASSQDGTLVPSEHQQQQFEGNVLDMLFENVPDTKESLDKDGEENLLQETDGHISASNSPFDRIRRKVRVYKNKRRKIDSNQEQVKIPCEKIDSSLMRLWEIFQSSDNMEVEFHGFED